MDSDDGFQNHLKIAQLKKELKEQEEAAHLVSAYCQETKAVNDSLQWRVAYVLNDNQIKLIR